MSYFLFQNITFRIKKINKIAWINYRHNAIFDSNARNAILIATQELGVYYEAGSILSAMNTQESYEEDIISMPIS